MSDLIVTDTWAWVEYFRGSKSGKKATKYIEERELVIPSIVIAELSDVFRRNGKEKSWEEEKRPLLKIMGTIVPLGEDIADTAGKIKSERRKKTPRFGMADAIVEATRLHTGGKILTGDSHLLGKNTIDIT